MLPSANGRRSRRRFPSGRNRMTRDTGVLASRAGSGRPHSARLTSGSLYFQQLSSLICAIDCRGSEMSESHSLQTLTRMFEKVTAERVMRISRVSKRAWTCFLQTEQVVADVSPSCHGACITPH